MNTTLSQRQRILAAVVYLLLLWMLYARIAGLAGSNDQALFWFYSGALMIVLGKYVVEPFFTTPADAVVNALTLLIALSTLPRDDGAMLFGMEALRYYGLTVATVAVVAIALKDATTPFGKRSAQVAYKVAELSGKSQYMFSALYWSASYSFLAERGQLGLFISAVALWICIIFFDVAGRLLEELSKAFRWLRSRGHEELGIAIGCDNPLQYTVEVDYSRYKGQEPKYGELVAIETRTNVGLLGMIVSRKQLLGKSWLTVYILTTPPDGPTLLDLRRKKLVSEPKSIFAGDNRVFLVNLAEDLAGDDRRKVVENPLYKDRQNFVGYTTRDSNINTVSFVILRDRDATDRQIAEGTILKTAIYGEDTLYQVINGNTREEHLKAFDTHGFTVGIARKLGKYNAAARELETRKWMPDIYSPLFFGYGGVVSRERLEAIAHSAIGRLPETDLEVGIKDLDAIVTHNTAILGILGIGKSCLAYELIKRVSDHGVKVICIDVTNEYKRELPAYVAADGAIAADDENAFNDINAAFGYVHVENGKQVPDRSGNLRNYRESLRRDLSQFLFATDAPSANAILDAARRVRIYNVDYHKASRGEKIGFNVLAVEMTQAEKTRAIAEEVFKLLMRMPLQDEKRAKVLLVFEEAHSLIPEWNSVASDGDQNATNGTAKVILQGRKYGLGSLVITQRTANVSKSVLNQCNTVFALRVYDDTGKTFLENYIGKDYADTLPTLEERHAIAIGKGLRLKQPVIVRLNERSDVLRAAAPTADELAEAGVAAI